MISNCLLCLPLLLATDISSNEKSLSFTQCLGCVYTAGLMSGYAHVFSHVTFRHNFHKNYRSTNIHYINLNNLQ